MHKKMPGIPEPMGSVLPMHSDERIAPKLDVAVRTFDDSKSVFRNVLVLELIDRYIELLQLVRYVKDDDQVVITASRTLDLLADLEVFLGELPVDQPRSLEEFKRLGAEVRHHYAEERRQLEDSMKAVAAECRETKRRLEEAQRVDRRNLGTMHSAIGSRVNRLAELLDRLQGQCDLAEQVARLTAEKQALESKLTEAQRDALLREMQGIEALIGRFEQAAVALDVGIESEPTVSAPDRLQVADLSRGLRQRSEWLQQCSSRQAEAESVRDDIAAEQSDIEEVLRFGSADEIERARVRGIQLERELQALNSYIEHLVAMQEQERRKLAPIKRYCDAHTLLKRGVSQDVRESIGQPLPGIPELPASGSTAEMVDDEHLQLVAGTDSDFSRRSTLDRIAATHGLKTAAVLLLTLYEALPLGRARGGKGQRGLLSVASAARKAGLLRIFGQDADDEVWMILRGTGEKSNELFKGLLTYRGAIRGRHIYVRSDDQLPWNVGDLLTAEEIKIFKDGILSWKKEEK